MRAPNEPQALEVSHEGCRTSSLKHYNMLFTGLPIPPIVISEAKVMLLRKSLLLCVLNPNA